MRVLGAVLAGGQSRRFGSDKAEAMIAGIRLVDLAAQSLSPFTEAVVVVGRHDPALPSVPDIPTAGLGPLGGLCGALSYAREHGYDAVLTTACDVPALPAELVEQLIALQPAVNADQPVVGCWPAALSERLLAFLDGHRRAVRAWCEDSGARLVKSDVPLANINTPDDLPPG